MKADFLICRFIETGWVDHEDRKKTVKGILSLEQVPDEVFDDLNVTFFAPSQHKFGEVYPDLPSGILIYLSPDLEQQPQEEVNFTIAHELAHAFLGHQHIKRNTPSIEDEADALAVKWGFILPERRRV
jgi:hypothetical protein